MQQKPLINEEVEESKKTVLFKIFEKEKTAYKEWIKENNEKFEQLSTNQKKVELAKDVILQINSGFFNVTRGTFFSKQSSIKSEDLGEDLLLGTQCTVCAKGALFAADIMKKGNCSNDKFKVDKGNADVYNRLGGIFTKAELDEIEVAFEMWIGHGYSDAYHFGTLYDSSAERLEAIMQNIIDNEGTFKP